MAARVSASSGKPAAKPRRPAAAKPRPAAQPGRRAALAGGDGGSGEQPGDPLDAGTVEFEPVRLVSPSEDEEQQPELRIPLFTIDGKEYTIPARPRVTLALDFMRMSRLQGPFAATDYMLEELLGTEGYAALRSFRGDLTGKQFQTIVAIATRVTFGASEDGPKDSPSD